MSEVIKKAKLERAYQEVERVLAFGDVKHGNAWKTKSLEYVMRHAVSHEALAELGYDRDLESGCHNLAHGIARRLMALDKILENKKDGEERGVEAGGGDAEPGS